MSADAAARPARRRFLAYSAASLAASATAALLPRRARAQPRALRYADMHTHASLKLGLRLREAMERNGVLIVAEKVIPDGLLTRLIGNRLASFREAAPGELRRNFESGFASRRARAAREGLVEISSAGTLGRAVQERTPGMVLASEGADFLEGDLGYLERVRAQGLAHLQLVHYYRQSMVGDISTEEPVHGGLTAFGKDVVRACNRLGILVDVAHCTSDGIAQALDISTRPVIYSHGHVSAGAPRASQGGIAARAMHAPLAKRLAEHGGVIGLWPLWNSYANLDLYCDELVRLAQAYGAEHVGIGSDMQGLVRSIMPSYDEFGELPAYLAKRGMKDPEIDAVLGGNYIRVLGHALAL
jgi:membrane dipeptidase